MKRLTNKYFSINPPRSIRKCRQDFYVTIEDKLRRLEDIEEDIGCPIETLFKAMKQGLFYKEYSGDIKEFMPDGSQFIAPDLPNEGLLLLHVSAYEDCIIIEKGFALNGYGTEWALTKEELEK